MVNGIKLGVAKKAKVTSFKLLSETSDPNRATNSDNFDKFRTCGSISPAPLASSKDALFTYGKLIRL